MNDLTRRDLFRGVAATAALAGLPFATLIPEIATTKTGVASSVAAPKTLSFASWRETFELGLEKISYQEKLSMHAPRTPPGRPYFSKYDWQRQNRRKEFLPRGSFAEYVRRESEVAGEC